MAHFYHKVDDRPAPPLVGRYECSLKSALFLLTSLSKRKKEDTVLVGCIFTLLPSNLKRDLQMTIY